MYKLKVNDYNFSVEITGDELVINGDKISADIKQLNDSAWHVIKDLKSYNVEVVSFNSSEKTAEVKINHNIYSVSAKDQFDLLLDKMGLSSLNAAKMSDIKAPMPGMVLKVFVTEGMKVAKGDNLFVLEAMKMENIIKSSGEVTVKTVKIKAGDKVEKGQILLVV